MTTRRRVPLRDDPDQPHAYQPRKVTDRGRPWPDWWEADGPKPDRYQSPCRHCGGSKSLPIHWIAA